jgi:pimeloyl-ACP methyl ester carboxylesterase
MSRSLTEGYVPFSQFLNFLCTSLPRCDIGSLAQRVARRSAYQRNLLDSFVLRIFRPQVILIHGLSVPSLIYHRLVPYLTSANHRVLLYDLYGRGYSDAPQTTYDAPLYAIQLALLMQHVRWDSARLVGLSMGGSIVAYFTSTFPWLVENRVALLASTGLVEVRFMPCFLL